MKTILTALLLAGLCAAPALAEQAAADGAGSAPGAAPGVATRAWLQLQADGSQASAHAQTLSGAAMERIYNRYLRSFTLPIPLRMSGTGSTGMGGTGGMGGSGGNAPAATR